MKFVSVSGDVVRPGVYEIPMGTTVAELIELAGGKPGEKVSITWTDNKGDKRTDEATVA
mgnify:CR=1 FL=1